jgi:hypothetical protein
MTQFAEPTHPPHVVGSINVADAAWDNMRLAASVTARAANRGSLDCVVLNIGVALKLKFGLLSAAIVPEFRTAGRLYKTDS